MSDIAKNILKFSDKVNFLTNDRNLNNITEKFTNDNNSEEENMRASCNLRIAFRVIYSIMIMGLLYTTYGFGNGIYWILAFLSLVAPDIVLIIVAIALITAGMTNTEQTGGSYSATSSDVASNKLLLSATPDIFN